MYGEHLKPMSSSDQMWAAWKGVEPEDMQFPVVREVPTQAVIHLTSVAFVDDYSSGSNFPGDIPFGD